MVKTLLVVDDDEMLCHLAKLTISDLAPSLEVKCSTSPEVALEFIRNNPVNYILSDFMMPTMNGIELLETIRKEGYDTPFVIISGHPKNLIEPHARESGALACFVKEPSITLYDEILRVLGV